MAWEPRSEPPNEFLLSVRFLQMPKWSSVCIPPAPSIQSRRWRAWLASVCSMFNSYLQPTRGNAIWCPASCNLCYYANCTHKHHEWTDLIMRIGAHYTKSCIFKPWTSNSKLPIVHYNKMQDIICIRFGQTCTAHTKVCTGMPRALRALELRFMDKNIRSSSRCGKRLV